MDINKVYLGDCLETMKTFPDNSIDSVITSPPYWQLRDYGWNGQWGLEPTFNQYLDNLISLMTEVKRVLKDTGTAWINLGDTYARGSRPKGGEEHSVSKRVKGTAEPITKPDYGELDKCLLLIPHRFAIRCIDELGLILRNDIIWAKPNGMPESVTDRFSKKHEFFFFFAKNEKYYFDLDSIRKPFAESSIQRLSQNIERQEGSERVPGKSNGNMKAVGKTKIPEETAKMFGSPRARNYNAPKFGGNKADGYGARTYSGNEWEIKNEGANPGDVSDFWKIPTKPNKAKHYATYNSQLIDKPIIAGCPEGGIILDPFAGTGTTLARAIQLNRQAIGIEGNPEYCKIAQERIKNELDQFKLAI